MRSLKQEKQNFFAPPLRFKYFISEFAYICVGFCVCCEAKMFSLQTVAGSDALVITDENAFSGPTSTSNVGN